MVSATPTESDRGAQRPEDNDLGVLLKQLSNLVTPMAVRTAATLRLVDHIQDGARTVDELAVRTDTHAPTLVRLVRHLVVNGVLEGGEDGGPLSVTRIGLLLADDHPAQQRAWLDLNGAVARADLAFTGLLDTVRTGRPAYPGRYGRPFWEDLSADRDLADSFDALMSCDDNAAYEAPVAAYDWSGVRHVLDVGGGNGALLAQIVRAAPHVRATLLELSGPADQARRKLAEAGLADRVTVVEGDFFKPLPVTTDVVILSFVLLNWSDEDARAILRRCAESLEPGGRLLVMDRADAESDGADRFFSTLLDLRMLTFMGGRVRTREEVVDLVSSVGFALASERTSGNPVLPFDFSVLEFRRDPQQPTPAEE